MNEHLSRSEVENLLSVAVLAKLVPCTIATSMVETQGLLESGLAIVVTPFIEELIFTRTFRGISSAGNGSSSAQENSNWR